MKKPSRTVPHIGVTAARHGGWWMWQFNRLALHLAGARAIHIRPQNPVALDELDGLLIGGGDDIGIELWRGSAVPAIMIEPERDRLERDLVHRAVERGMPLLGICRGAQMINVALGGTLHEEIGPIFGTAPHRRILLPRLMVEMSAGSRLARLIGSARLRVNALHHQAIDRPGAGLRAVGHDREGIVQAIERAKAGGFLYGVQWHPEFQISDRRQRRLFAALGRAARRYRSRNQPVIDSLGAPAKGATWPTE